MTVVVVVVVAGGPPAPPVLLLLLPAALELPEAASTCRDEEAGCVFDREVEA